MKIIEHFTSHNIIGNNEYMQYKMNTYATIRENEYLPLTAAENNCNGVSVESI